MIAKVHPNFPDYEIHDDGRVFRIKLRRRVGKGNYGRLGEINGRVLKESGYRQFKLCHANGTQVLIRANRLVAEVFHGPAPSPKHHACHNDGVKLNNRADNLRWDLPKENNADQVIHGTRRRGSQSPVAILTDEQVLEIRQKFCGVRGQIRQLARQFCVSFSAMARIVYGENYSTVGEIKFSRKPKSTAQDRELVLHAYVVHGFGAAEALAASVGISRKEISRIARNHGFVGNHLRGRNITVQEKP